MSLYKNLPSWAISKFSHREKKEGPARHEGSLYLQRDPHISRKYGDGGPRFWGGPHISVTPVQFALSGSRVLQSNGYDNATIRAGSKELPSKDHTNTKQEKGLKSKILYLLPQSRP